MSKVMLSFALLMTLMVSTSNAAKEVEKTTKSHKQYPTDAYGRAPIRGLNARGEQYQLGVWTAIIFFLAALYGFYFVAYIDYSQDTLLYVEVEQHSGHE